MIYQVAIDGPAASGKSSTARRVAAALEIQYLDTGAMYRALTLHVIESGISVKEESLVQPLLAGFNLQVEAEKIILAGRDVSSAIRENRISTHMGPICAMRSVRDWMLLEQRRLGSLRSTVVDGRDIGTVVFPDARFKFFLVADVEVRARRRQLELEERGEAHQLGDLVAELTRRDESDRNRQFGPLRQAQDACLLDTSQLSLQEQVDAIVSKVQRGLARVA